MFGSNDSVRRRPNRRGKDRILAGARSRRMRMDSDKTGKPQVTPEEPEHPGSGRDPEERSANKPDEVREKSLDKTLADSFPTSDPPSTIPDPEEDDANAA